MKKFRKKIIRIAAISMALFLITFFFFFQAIQISPPEVPNLKVGEVQKIGNGAYKIGKSWLRKREEGVWEMYLEGDSYQMGLHNALLAKALIQKQEKAFVSQIREMIPSDFYLNFLKYFIAFFNRDLPKQIPHEYLQEIYGVSQTASPDFDFMAPPYGRILNYHAAHDIGHALQNMKLVGCSAFAAWGNKSYDNNLITARNFDFYVGDEFAEEKIICFFKPKKGYPFMTVTWGGMIGAVSGMNIHGLSVSLNAAPSAIPSVAATPVSLIAREVLQYAKNIEEAKKIIQKRNVFVSELFLIASAEDKKAVVIEKTPEKTAVFLSKEEFLICTNHFQSDDLKNKEENITFKKESDSPYRYEKLIHLIRENIPINAEKAASILRNDKGNNNENIGYTNEKAINQYIAHHSIIFQNSKKIVQISTKDWGMGKFTAYYLPDFFSKCDSLDLLTPLHQQEAEISADSLWKKNQYPEIKRFKNLKSFIIRQLKIENVIPPDSLKQLLISNPNYFLADEIAADVYFSEKNVPKAYFHYQNALKKSLSSAKDSLRIVEKIKKLNRYKI